MLHSTVILSAVVHYLFHHLASSFSFFLLNETNAQCECVAVFLCQINDFISAVYLFLVTGKLFEYFWGVWNASHQTPIIRRWLKMTLRLLIALIVVISSFSQQCKTIKMYTKWWHPFMCFWPESSAIEMIMPFGTVYFNVYWAIAKRIRLLIK